MVAPEHAPRHDARRNHGTSLFRFFRFGRDFTAFWLGQTLSSVGDAVARIALPLLVLQATGSVARMGIVAGVSGVGQLVGGIIAGPLADRADRRRLMLVCDSARAVLYATVPLAWWLGGPRFPLICAVAFFGTLLGMCFSVAYITAIPNLVDADHVTEANGQLQASDALAGLVGPVLAGLLAARVGAATALGVDALSFVASLLSLAGIRFRHARASQPVAASQRWLGQLRAGVRFLWMQPALRALTCLIAGFSFLTLGATDLVIYYLAHDLHQSDSAVGFVFGIASVGAMAGGLLAAPARRRWGFGACYLGGAIAEGIVFAALGIAPALALVVPLLMGYAFCEIFKGVNSIALRQQVTPDHLLGRVTAAFWTINSAPGPVGAAVLTALAARVGASAVLIGAGIAFTTVALLGLRSAAASARPEGVLTA